MKVAAKLVVALVVVLGATVQTKENSSSILVGDWKQANCPAINEAFASPSQTFIIVMRYNPRQADDFVRNYSQCHGTNAIGRHQSTKETCAVIVRIDEFMQKHGLSFTVNNAGRGGNAADFANNANDCFKAGF